MDGIIAEMVGMAIGWMEVLLKYNMEHGIFIGRTSMQYSACG
jgi:hypothetical protein